MAGKLMKIRTFIDSGVLISGARGEANLAKKALQILGDDKREFVSSVFLKMEVLPKAIFNQQNDEIEFYTTYFDSVSYWATDINEIINLAYQESSKFGLGAMDALHIAAANLMNATEFITSEKPQKSIHRTKTIQVISIHSSIM
jgi:predicted nucleic acid-binding protein